MKSIVLAGPRSIITIDLFNTLLQERINLTSISSQVPPLECPVKMGIRLSENLFKYFLAFLSEPDPYRSYGSLLSNNDRVIGPSVG